MNARDKILPLTELPALVETLKKEGKKIVTTNGCFDILHIGHLRALEASNALGDVLIVGINSDASVKDYKSPLRPIVPQAERAEMIAGLACVDYVTIFPERNPIRFLELVQPDIHTKSSDRQADKLPETPIVRQHGGDVVMVPLIPGQSTTKIIDRIREAYREEP